MSDYLSRYYNLRVFLFWHTWVRPAVSSPFLLTVNKREPTWNANADKKKNSLKHRPQHALAARVTHLKWLKARSPFPCWRSFESQKHLKLVAATNFCQPVIIYFSLCDFLFLFFLCFFFFLSFFSLLSAMQLWGITGSSWCERRGRSSQSESVTSACRMRASTPARSSPCPSRPQRPFSPYWVSVIHCTWLIRILVPGA